MRVGSTCRFAFCLTLGVARLVSAATSQSVELLPQADWNVLRDDVFKVYSDSLGLGAEDRMELLLERPSLAKPLTAAFYRQTYRGVAVEGGTFSLSLRDGLLVSGVGRVIAGLSADVRPVVSEKDALAYATAALARSAGVDPQRLSWLAPPRAELMLLSPDGSFDPRGYRLAFRWTLVPTMLMAGAVVDVDAVTGEILRQRSVREQAWTPAQGHGTSPFNGAVDFAAETDDATGQFRLHGQSVETYDFHGAAPQDVTSGDSQFGQAAQAPAVGVQWSLQHALGYFQSAFGASCLAGQLGTLPAARAYLIDWDNAAFDAGQQAFFFGSDTGTPLVALDVVGHESAHCVRRQLMPNPLAVFTGEDGAVNEGFADIFGEMIQRDTLGSTDWIMGADVPHFRNLVFPALSTTPAPDAYHGPNWDFGGVNPDHINASVQDRWFTLLAFGGAGTNSLGLAYDVKGIGEDTAARIAFQGLTDNVTPDYNAARLATVQAAVQLCGDFSREVASAHDAWHAVGVESSPFVSLPLTQPAAGASAVEPWPALLRWQAVGTQAESEWDVIVSPSSDFTADVHTYLTGDTTTISGTLVGKVDGYLRPDTTYYWKVRRHSALPDPSCYRPVHSFTTKSKRVDLISPLTAKGALDKFYPWQLDFSWKPMAGITAYALEVATDSSFDPDTLLFPQREVDGATHIVLDVRVGTTLHWRVRPLLTTPDDAEIVPGSWSAGVFETTTPTVVLTSPVQGADVFPWPVNMAWHSVTGATKFILEVQSGRVKDWGDPEADFQQISLPASVTSYSNLNVRANEWDLQYSWRVRVVGPSVADGNGFPEEGTPGQGAFHVTKAQTEVTGLKPGLSDCVPVQGSVDLSWSGVTNATAYRLFAAEAVCTWDVQSQTAACAPGPEFELKRVDASGASTETLSTTEIPGPLTQKGNGFYWRVKALGPDGLPGWDLGQFIFTNKRFMWRPDKPTLTLPVNGAQSPLGDDVQLAWNTAFAPVGGFVVDVYQNGDGLHCDSGSLIDSFVVMGNTFGTSTTTLSNLLVDDNAARHSWRVSPFVLNWNGVPGVCPPAPSTCHEFQVANQTVVPDTPTVIPQAWYAGVGQLLVVFSIENGATTYGLEIHAGDPVGQQVFAHSYTVAELVAARDGFFNSLGYSTPPGLTNWVGTISGTQAGEHYFYKANACNSAGCSPWSGWSEWDEIYYLPWPW